MLLLLLKAPRCQLLLRLALRVLVSLALLHTLPLQQQAQQHMSGQQHRPLLQQQRNPVGRSQQ